MPRNVLIYRDLLLESSESFILAQAEGLSRYRPVSVGTRRAPGIAVPPERSLIFNEGGWPGMVREMLFKVGDRVPRPQVDALRRLSPALVHAHFGPDGVLGMILAQTLRLPLVVTF